MERRDFLKATIAAIVAHGCLPLLKVEAGGRTSSMNIFTEPPAIEPITGYLGRFTPLGGGDMRGSFRATYSLVTCQGSKGNKSVGTANAGSLDVMFSGMTCTTQEVRSKGASTVNTSVKCAGELGTASKWTLRSNVAGVKNCGFVEKGTWDGRTMIVRSKSWRQERATSNPLIARWALLKHVASGRFKKSPLTFDMLDDSTLRPDQVLRYTGRIEIPVKGGKARLDCYAQTGRAIVPIHYLVDSAGRVQLITNSNVNWALRNLQ
jgi:hypothetical protein